MAARWESQQGRHPPEDAAQGRREPRARSRARRARSAPAHGAAVGAAAHRSRPMAPKIYPDKGTSCWLSFEEPVFPFHNFSFAMGIGLVYWMITWQFHSDYQAIQHLRRPDRCHRASPASGRSTGRCRSSPAGDAQHQPLVHADCLFAAIVWYVDAVERPRWRRIRDQGHRRHRAFPGARRGHVRDLPGLRRLQQLAGAEDRGPARADRQCAGMPDQGWLPSVIVEETLEPLSQAQAFEQRQAQSSETADPDAQAAAAGAPGPTSHGPFEERVEPGRCASSSACFIRSR